jgi:hypothetical protein
MKICTLNLKSWGESGNPKIGVKNVVVAMLGDTSNRWGEVNLDWLIQIGERYMPVTET